MLDHELGPWNDRRVYRLDHLLERVAFDTDPEDALTISIRRMCLAQKTRNRRIILEADPDCGVDDIYQMLGEETRFQRDRRAYALARATFQIELQEIPHVRKAGSMSFDVGYPDICTLRSQSPERIRLVQKYLKRFDIDVTEPNHHGFLPRHAVPASVLSR